MVNESEEKRNQKRKIGKRKGGGEKGTTARKEKD